MGHTLMPYPTAQAASRPAGAPTSADYSAVPVAARWALRGKCHSRAVDNHLSHGLL